MSHAIQAVVGIVEIAVGAVLDYFSFGTLGNALILAGVGQLLGYAISLLLNPHRGPLIPIGAAYAGTLEPRRIIFGQLRTSGMYTAPPLTYGSNNDFLVVVLTIAGHPVSGFGDIYFNQIRIANGDIGTVSGSSSDGQVSNSITNNGFQGKVWIRRYNGSQTAPDYILNTNFTAWDNNHIGKNIAYWAISLQYDTTVFATGLPQISGMVQGAAVYDPRLDSTNGGTGPQRFNTPSTWTYSTNPALCLRYYLTSALGLGEAQTRIDDVLVAAAANICDSTVSVPIPVVPGLLNWQNGSTVVGGVGTAFLRDLNNGQFVQVGGNFYPAPHPATTIYLLGPDNNMYAVASVQSDTQLTLASGFTGTSAFDQVSQWNLSAATTTTQARYTCNTLLDCTARFEDNIAQIARAMMGQCVYSGGKWRMYAGAWSGSAFSLAESDLVGGVSIQCATPRQNLYNAVRGNFINPARGYNPDEFPPILNSTYSTADGETIFTETNFPCCTDIFEAQRNAFIVSRVSRDQKVCTAQFGLSAYGVRVWDTGTVTISEVGWVNQTVRCIGWKFTPKGSIELTLQEAYSADWTDPVPASYAIKGTNATGATSLYLPYPPTGLTATSVAGGILFQVTLPSQRPLGGSRIQLWEYTASTPFSSATLLIDSLSTQFFVPKFDTIQRYYWVRIVTTQEQVGAQYPAGAGVAGVALSASAKWDQIGNLFSTASWVVGTTGSQGNYAQLLGGTGAVNTIVLGDGSSSLLPLGPFDTTQAIWQARTGSTSSNGGYSNALDTNGIDSTKTYRASVWIMYTGPTTSAPSIIHGADTGGSITNLGGTVDGNPQFVNVVESVVTPGKWYLAVGLIHGSGYTGGQSGVSGLYDPATGDRVPGLSGLSNGAGVSLGSDFKFTAGVTQTLIRSFSDFGTSSSNYAFLVDPRFEMVNGQEPSIRDLLTPGVVDLTMTPAQIIAHTGPVPRHGVLPKGNIPPMVQDGVFSYTSTSTTVTITWPAYKVYRPDGTNFSISSGSAGPVTGLVASTTYVGYGYTPESSPTTMTLENGWPGMVGTAPVVFPPTATTAQLAVAFADASQLPYIYQGKFTAVTTASGSGGGGGGGGGFGPCPHQDQWMLTSNGAKRAGDLEVGDELLTPHGWSPILKVTKVEQREWVMAWFDNDACVTVTPEHRFMLPDGEPVRACELTLGQIVASAGPWHLTVSSLRLRKLKADAVKLELAPPHVYFFTADGPLNHNWKP